MVRTILDSEQFKNISSRNPKTYKKIFSIKAIQLDVDFIVVTKEGTIRGKAGDYLCQGVTGEKWPVDRIIFESSYQEIIT